MRLLVARELSFECLGCVLGCSRQRTRVDCPVSLSTLRVTLSSQSVLLSLPCMPKLEVH